VNVAVGSMWRNMGPVMRDRIDQFYKLGLALIERGDRPVCVFVENDSRDDTWAELYEFGGCGHIESILMRASDGCPHWPSVDHPDRWRHLAWVANHTIDNLPADTDVFLYVESDLLWSTGTMLALIDQAVEHQAAVAACNRFANGRWYETWGSRIRGMRFKPAPPHHPALEAWEGGLIPVDSVCGAIAMPGEIARQVRFQPEDCFVGLCRDIRQKGYGMFLDPALEVIHPPS
jgi:hypothetical protein